MSRPKRNEQASRPGAPAEADQELPALGISPEKVCFIIAKAREFEAKDIVTELDTGTHPSDDSMVSVPEDHGDDPVLEELTSFISNLSEEEQIDLVALAWLGRDDNTIDDWPALREEAAQAHNARTTGTAEYLLGIPLLGDYLEEGLSQFGQSCSDFGIGRL